MEYTIIKEAHEQMAQLAKRHNGAVVAFSGGKDSLVCLDLAVKHFRRVVPVFMFLVPGLRCIDEKLQVVRDRWHLEVLHYPHLLFFRAYENSLYCKKSIRMAKFLKEFGLNEIYKAIMHDTGINLIVNGSKEADSLWRKTKFFKFYTMENVVYPLKKWRKNDVLAYLQMEKIPIPASSGAASTGVDLSTPSLLWLHDAYPDDFGRMEWYFPFIGAVVKRRELHGIK
jgi:3'-phosphoadenosine 5'-phosphosulfate sulfotransferase (PAPS reductase)/FAD synthetase